MKENPIVKVWTLLLLQWGVKYEQQALEDAMDIIKPWRPLEQALKATMIVIKPWRLVSDWLEWLGDRDGSGDATGTACWNVQQG